MNKKQYELAIALVGAAVTAGSALITYFDLKYGTALVSFLGGLGTITIEFMTRIVEDK